MTEPTTRTARIEQYFHDKLTRCASIALPLNRERFEAEAGDDPSNLHKPFGWMPPYERPPHGPFIFPYCPAIISEQTELLSDGELQEYLETLGFIVSMHIQHIDRPLEDRERMIDRTLYDIAAGSMALMNRVQMQAIDPKTERPS